MGGERGAVSHGNGLHDLRKALHATPSLATLLLEAMPSRSRHSLNAKIGGSQIATPSRFGRPGAG